MTDETRAEVLDLGPVDVLEMLNIVTRLSERHGRVEIDVDYGRTDGFLAIVEERVVAKWAVTK